MLLVLRTALVVGLTAGLLGGPAAATAVPLDRDLVKGPKGSMPGELWEALETPRRPARVSRAVELPAEVADTPAEEPAEGDLPPNPAPLPTANAAGDPIYFASRGPLQLRLPGGVRALGFHESGARGALPLHPIGRPTHNDNMGKLREAPVDHANGTNYVIMGSRGRGGGPTTAVDIAMPEGWPLQSPVTGTVEVVQSYRLYGRMNDYLVQIIPDDAPDLRVKLLHLDTVHVAPGHRVVEGETIIAGTSRSLPVRNQVDRYAGPGPHVHLEIING